MTVVPGASCGAVFLIRPFFEVVDSLLGKKCVMLTPKTKEEEKPWHVLREQIFCTGSVFKKGDRDDPENRL